MTRAASRLALEAAIREVYGDDAIERPLDALAARFPWRSRDAIAVTASVIGAVGERRERRRAAGLPVAPPIIRRTRATVERTEP